MTLVLTVANPFQSTLVKASASLEQSSCVTLIQFCLWASKPTAQK